MICPHCQHDLDMDAMRCPRCGLEYAVSGLGLAVRARTWLFAFLAMSVVALIVMDCVLGSFTGGTTQEQNERKAAQSYGSLLAAKSPEAQRTILMMLQKQQATQNTRGATSPTGH